MQSLCLVSQIHHRGAWYTHLQSEDEHTGMQHMVDVVLMKVKSCPESGKSLLLATQTIYE
jgi:hypothetical protein